MIGGAGSALLVLLEYLDHNSAGLKGGDKTYKTSFLRKQESSNELRSRDSGSEAGMTVVSFIRPFHFQEAEGHTMGLPFPWLLPLGKQRK